MQATAHEGASGLDRVMARWRPLLGSADADLLRERGDLVARARDLSRNHPLAAGGYQTVVDNVIGTGLRLQAQPDWRALGRDQAWGQAWARQVESRWRAWADRPACDAGGKLHFTELTRLAFRSVLYHGEALALPIWLPQPGAPAATRLHLIEPDRLCTPYGMVDNATLRAGVESDAWGAPTAYWIAKTHPGDWRYTRTTLAWERVPATTPWGRRRVIHCVDVDRIGQTRGRPLMSAVLKQFRILDRYTDAELQAAALNAMVAAFIETQLDMPSLLNLFGGPAGSGERFLSEYLQRQQEHTVDFEPGSIIPLFPGEKLSTFAPGRPSGNFDPFTVSVLRQIAAGMNIPYELLSKDFSKTNYSSARAAMLEAWRFFIGRRKWVSDYWATPIYVLFLEEQIGLGFVDAPGYFDDPAVAAAYQACRWIGPGRGWVDPLKEAQAAGERMRAGLSTLQQEAAEQGGDWEETLEQQAREQARRRELGLAPLADPGAPVPAPDPAADPEAGTTETRE